MTESTASSSARKDPIRTRYFEPLEKAEAVSSWLFYVAALISLAVALVDKNAHPTLYQVVVVCFLMTALAMFGIGNATRLYFFPRAEDARRSDFVSNAFGFDFIRERTEGYYNNAETDPIRKVGVNALENLFYTKSILQEMAPGARIHTFCFLALGAALFFWRETPLDMVATAAQVLFSEEIIARFFRLEWARARAERLYEATYRVFQSRPTDARLAAFSVDAFVQYESGKSISAILLSRKLFDRLNPRLSAEWEEIKKGLGLK